MRVIREGYRGADVEAWQTFLRGQDASELEVDGVYAGPSIKLTLAFQAAHGLVADGVIGPRTYACAQAMGFNPGFIDEDPALDGPNWPPPPPFEPLDPSRRGELFGTYQFEPDPTPGNREGIRILGDWEQKNIVSVPIPQLATFTHGRPIRLHRLAAPLFTKFFADVEAANLAPAILSFGGAFVARFIRGSTSRLSPHAYGTAVDLNVPWNRLGTTPALRSKQGSVRALVPIANDCGLFWGGHFKQRPDGMHFEVARI